MLAAGGCGQVSLASTWPFTLVVHKVLANDAGIWGAALAEAPAPRFFFILVES